MDVGKHTKNVDYNLKTVSYSPLNMSNKSPGVSKLDEARTAYLKSFLKDMLKLKSSSATFFEYLTKAELMEEELEERIYAAVLQHIIDPNARIYEPKRFQLSNAPLVVPTSLQDLNFLEDSEFWTLFHISRKNMRAITKDVRRTSLEIEHESNETPSTEVLQVPLEKTIQLCIWYLRNSDVSVLEGARLFELHCDLFEGVLRRGLRLLVHLKKNSGMNWPSKKEFEETARAILDKYKIPEIAGVITHHIFTALDKKRLNLQAVCDENHVFRSAFICYDSRPRVGVMLEKEFLQNLSSVPEGLRIAGDGAYADMPKRLTAVLMTPNKDATQPIMKAFYQVHAAILSIAIETVNEMAERFPRVKQLHSTIPDAIIAACVLHNYCQLYQDLAPLV